MNTPTVRTPFVGAGQFEAKLYLPGLRAPDHAFLPPSEQGDTPHGQAWRNLGVPV
jgi:hypothetical protein